MTEPDPLEPGLRAYLDHTRRVTAGLGPLGGLTAAQRRERAELYALATREAIGMSDGFFLLRPLWLLLLPLLGYLLWRLWLVDPLKCLGHSW